MVTLNSIAFWCNMGVVENQSHFAEVLLRRTLSLAVTDEQRWAIDKIGYPDTRTPTSAGCQDTIVSGGEHVGESWWQLQCIRLDEDCKRTQSGLRRTPYN